jgi:hypothetical protein
MSHAARECRLAAEHCPSGPGPRGDPKTAQAAHSGGLPPPYAAERTCEGQGKAGRGPGRPVEWPRGAIWGRDGCGCKPPAPRMPPRSSKGAGGEHPCRCRDHRSISRSISGGCCARDWRPSPTKSRWSRRRAGIPGASWTARAAGWPRTCSSSAYVAAIGSPR